MAAAVDDDAAGIGIGRFIKHFGRHRLHGQRGAQTQQRAQLGVLSLKLIGARKALGLLGQLLKRRVLGLHGALGAAQIVASGVPGIHGREQALLERMQG